MALTLTFKSPRMPSSASITLVRTETGWELDHPSGGECDKTGAPFLLQILDNECIAYPSNLGEYFNWLWEAAERGENETAIQQGLTKLATWIDAVNEAAPTQFFGQFR